MQRKPLKAIVGLAAIGLLAAACGSSSSSSGTTTTTVKANGTPILVGQISPVTGANLALPEVTGALEASITALNNSGGINGHPLKLDQCDTQGLGSMEVQCAQQMVSDHVVATFEDNVFSNPVQVNSILEGAGIARIGITMNDVSDYANMDNFDFTGGGVFTLVGIVESLVHKGDTKLSVMLPDTGSASETHLLLDPIAASLGAKIVNYVLVSSASGDYSQYVAQAQQNGSQGTVVALGNSQLVQVAQVVDQLNPKMDFGTGISGLSLTQMKELKPFSTKAIYTWWTPGMDDVKDFPGLAQPLAVFKSYMKGFNLQTSTSIVLSPWMAVHAFAEIMKGQTGTATAASVLTAVKAAKDIQMNGIIKPWTPTAYQSPGSLGSIFKNVSNPYEYRISFNGTSSSTSTSELFNTFVGLPGSTATN
jgi:ABC-type branched-subunit amino acid transport system substrate-binding protein